MSIEPANYLALPTASASACALLTQHARAFRAAWEGEVREPPDLRAFIPTEPPTLRWMGLLELIKIDLANRLAKPDFRKPLERYLEEFPELRGPQGPPCDLVYEEFHLRRQAGEAVAPEEYYRRFPEASDRLQRVLALESMTQSTSVTQYLAPAGDLDMEKQIDDFDLLAPLGRGAFASVYLARQRSLGRMVALKVSDNRGQEPQTLAQLDHPNIVRVYDQRLLPERRLRLLYMQYVAGGTLQAVVDRVRQVPPAVRRGQLLLDVIDASLQGRGETPPTDSRTRSRLAVLSWPEAVCWLGARLGEALDYAHHRGVLHRDIKPANVLLGADASPKLADFNVSYCSKVQGATPLAYFGGSLAYMSPEQLEAFNPEHDRRPDDLDGRSDLFALATLLWELLTGERPFKEADGSSLSSETLDKMVALRSGGLSASALARVPHDCPPGMIEVLSKCLAADRSDRLRSPAGLAAQLDLCMFPLVQRLLRPRRQGWLVRMRRHPLIPFLVAGIAPNVIFSAFNIAYNWRELIVRLDSELVTQVFYRQILVINPLAYTIALGILIPLVWVALRATKRRNAGQEVDPLELVKGRGRSVWIGDYLAWIAGVEWLVSGVVFPVWLNAAGGEGLLQSQHYVHFLASQFLCGLMASTMSFLLVTMAMVKVCCPVLLEPCQDDSQTLDQLGRLAARTPFYSYLTFAVFPLALIVMPLVHTGSQAAFLVLGGLGLLDAATAMLLAREIQRDAATLQLAASSEAQASSGGSTSERFRARRTK
jgi:serine/threonine protein kinase